MVNMEERDIIIRKISRYNIFDHIPTRNEYGEEIYPKTFQNVLLEKKGKGKIRK